MTTMLSLDIIEQKRPRNPHGPAGDGRPAHDNSSSFAKMYFVICLALFSLIGVVKMTMPANDVTNVTAYSHDVTIIKPNNNTVEEDNKRAAEECLPSLQHLSHGAFVQCRKSWPPHECLTASDFWQRRCYLNITESVRFYHLGKGGGGTIFQSLVDNGIILQRDHPRPIHDIEQLINGPVTTLLINIRDPVDRFVSAFNWRSLLFCQRDEEQRKKYPSEVDQKDRGRYQPHMHPQEVCYDVSLYPKEAEIIQRLYNDDINKLAESLCEESSDFKQAVQATKFINHANLSLVRWLQFLIDKNMSSIKPQGLNKFMAITFEEQSGHNSSHLGHTHDAIRQLYFDHGVDEKALDSLMKHKPTRTKGESEKMIARTTHSSHVTGNDSVLGAVGECCLSRFLEDDYRLIQSMLGETNTTKATASFKDVHPIIEKACEWGSLTRRQLCRADLQSMLHRRARFLDRSLGTSCRDIVSGGIKPEQ